MSKSNTAVAVQMVAEPGNDSGLPAHLKAVEGVGRGNENVGDAVTVPRVKLLQKMNNEVDKHHNDYIEGCSVGDFVNTLSREVLGDEIYVISLHFNTEYVVWRDITKGGGYGGNFKTYAEADAYIQAQDNPAEYSADETHSHVLLIKNAETGVLEKSPVIMDFAKSKLRVSKGWNSQIGIKGGDRFSGLWKIKGVTTENKSGQTFMNLDVSWVGWATEEDYKAAEALYSKYA